MDSKALKVIKKRENPPRPKGSPRPPGSGRAPGTPNKTTKEAREAIADFVNGNAHRLTEWLDSVANGDPEHDIKPDPGRAFALFQSVVEYHVPKLARQETTGLDGGPQKLEITWKSGE